MATFRNESWASLLHVGSSNPALSKIRAELGPLVTPDPIGHDGQLYYLIARDPLGTDDTLATLSSFDTNPPRYRYRRILFPLLAGGFGQFGGWATLMGMIFWVAIGMGLATLATADMAFSLNLPGGAVFLAAINLGALVSALILTADVLALGLSLLGLALGLRGRYGVAIFLFALAGLTKEVYLLVPLSVAAWRLWERDIKIAVMMATITTAPVLLWSALVWSFVPEVAKTTPLVGLPFVGLLGSVSRWRELHGDSSVQLLMAAYAAVSFAIVSLMMFAGRSTLLRWIALPWLALAVCSTGSAAWDIPSNVARAFAIVWPLGVLMLAERAVTNSPLKGLTTRHKVQGTAEDQVRNGWIQTEPAPHGRDHRS
jgi:hypothetical protein